MKPEITELHPAKFIVLPEWHFVTKRQVKALINSDQWAKLGKMFRFTPRRILTGRKWVIDWACAPPAMADVLRGKDDFWFVKETPIVRKQSRRPKFAPKRADKLFVEQKGICHYCKASIERHQWSIDHKLPVCRGGRNHDENLVGACKSCNGYKGRMTESEYFKYLERLNHESNNRRNAPLLSESYWDGQHTPGHA